MILMGVHNCKNVIKNNKLSDRNSMSSVIELESIFLKSISIKQTTLNFKLSRQSFTQKETKRS